MKDQPSRGLDKNKGFSTSVTLDMSLEDKNVNIFLFKGSMKITGCNTELQAVEIYMYLCCHLRYLKYKKKIDVCSKIPTIKDIRWGLLNPKFNLGRSIDLCDLNNRMKGKGGFLSSYIPILVNEYVDIRFPSNLLKKDKKKKYRIIRIYKGGNVSMIVFGFREGIILYKFFWHILNDAYKN